MSKMRIWLSPALMSLVACLAVSAAKADGCPTPAADIATDRPDVANSSMVVPMGSLQSENGVNLTSRHGGTIVDGTNSRLRLGVVPCVEVLVDLPSYFASARGAASSGFSNVAPAVKWQIAPSPANFDLSATIGMGLPTGTRAVAGAGVQPYVQFPWSRELGDGWGLGGMVTAFFHPSEPSGRLTQETTLVIERQISARADLFVEYVGEFLSPAGPSHLINMGGAYRMTPTRQIDFHVGFGLNDNAPAYFFGIGYSFRLDGLF